MGGKKGVGKQLLWQSYSGKNCSGVKDCRCFGCSSHSLLVSNTAPVSSDVWDVIHTGMNTQSYGFVSKLKFEYHNWQTLVGLDCYCLELIH